METLIKDLHYGVRNLLKRPGLTAIALITLALGIGANTAIFSVVNAVVLRPLPYAEPDRLVTLWETMPGSDRRSVAPGNFTDWRAQNKTFEELAATFFGNFNLTSDGEPERIDGATITSNLMNVLGVRAQVGRTFQADDDEHQDRNVVLISDGLWKRRFGGEQGVVGRTITIDELPHTVVGVMGRGFQYPANSDIWVLGRDRGAVPLGLIAKTGNDWPHERDAHFIRVIGRLKSDATLSQAQSDIAGIMRRAEQDFPKSNAGLGSNLVPLHVQVVGDVRGMLFILLGAVGFVLLIACTNVANLMLARASQREREIAIRAAVGASRLRLIRQLLTESLLLSILGGLAGLVVSVWAVDVFIKLSPGDIPRLSEASVDLRLLAFTVAVSVITGIGFGLLPAFQATRTNLNNSLKDGGTKGGSEGRQRKTARSVLVATEVALAQVLLVGAALLAISYVRLVEIHPGFNPERVLTAKIAPSNQKYPDPKSRAAFFSTVLERLGNLPGVESAAVVMSLPLGGASMNRGFLVEGRPEPKADENISMDFQIISAAYFSTLEIPVKRGRGLTAADTESSQHVIVINEAMARRYWPNEDPVGKRIAIGESKDTSWRTIVGVVGDNNHASLSEPPVPTSFISYQQDFESWPRMGFVIKSKTDAASLGSTVRKELAAIDPAQPVYAVEPLTNLLSTSVAQRRFIMMLLGSLAAIAVALAMIGVYGVISFSVSERTHEIGIRMALGARTLDVLRMVLGQGMRVAMIGIAIGLVAGLALMRLLTSMLFQVSPTDFRTFTLVAVALAGVALVACYIPARRATKVDPLVALRYE